MGYKSRMFNRKASSQKSKPNQILETLALHPGQAIADIGAGGGYFSLRFANAVGSMGRVYAVDKNPEFLNYIRDIAGEEGFSNIVTILVTKDNPLSLPEEIVDLVFIRNVCHHLSNRAKYFRDLRKVLKPKGKVAIIEYKRDGGILSFRKLFGHYLPKEKIVEEMTEAGYRLEEDFDFLPEQSFTIFRIMR